MNQNDEKLIFLCTSPGYIADATQIARDAAEDYITTEGCAEVTTDARAVKENLEATRKPLTIDVTAVHPGCARTLYGWN